jgi:DNA-binding IclR family transcriptional regulator
MKERETSSDKTLSVIDLFTPDKPQWTIDEAAAVLGMSQSTVYRYFRSLAAAGLIFSVFPGRYLLGPGIIQYERQLRNSDPLYRAARPTLEALASSLGERGILFIARIYRDHLMPMFEQPLGVERFPSSFERGKLMPVNETAPALAILAHRPIRSLRKMLRIEEDPQDWPRDRWANLKRILRAVRTSGYSVTNAPDDTGIYISVPLLHPDGMVAGSLTFGTDPDGTSEPYLIACAQKLKAASEQIARDLLGETGAVTQ